MPSMTATKSRGGRGQRSHKSSIHDGEEGDNVCSIDYIIVILSVREGAMSLILLKKSNYMIVIRPKIIRVSYLTGIV